MTLALIDDDHPDCGRIGDDGEADVPVGGAGQVALALGLAEIVVLHLACHRP